MTRLVFQQAIEFSGYKQGQWILKTTINMFGFLVVLGLIKFMFSKKATKIDEIFTVDFTM